MRLKPIPPEQLLSDVRALHDDIVRGMNSHLSSFISARSDGALVGPFPPMLHYPQFGRAAWGNVKALIENSKLPKTAHEVAILATGAAFTSEYELYAHERVAKGVSGAGCENHGNSEISLPTWNAGQRDLYAVDDSEFKDQDFSGVINYLASANTRK